MRVLAPVTVLVSSLALGGCFFSSSSSKTEETSEELSKNPFKAVGQLAEAGQKMAEKQKEMAERKPVDPVKFDVLIPLLPDADGWKASEAKGATTAMAEFKISNAERTYEKGEGDAHQRVKIELVDGGYVPMVYAPFMMLTAFSQETSEGWSKGVTIDGFPAFEEHKKKQNDSKVVALVNDRFLVTVDGDNVSPETIRDFVAKVDLKKVAALQ